LSERGVRLANVEGRAVLVLGDGSVDVEERSGGAFPADPMEVLERWEAFREWAREQEPRDEDPDLDPVRLGPCVPRPRQVFAIGLNYRDHAEEAGLDIPDTPMVFTKFPSCLAGPYAEIVLTSDRVDWEVELVVVIGRQARGVDEGQALDYVAGYCVGQDISDRRLQFSDRPAQFSLGKSAAGYGPIGPELVSLDALDDPGSLVLSCEVGGERMQEGHTRDMIFGVPELVAYLSRYCTLEPGDLIFTGTPAGVGSVRTPRRYLAPGDIITSEIEGLGGLVNRCVAQRGPAPDGVTR
jgi:2-keto-4-pentenoate hydratase/2-oxohepta-3-ene-1,7-dioic acid hydratase in catechol pathway